MRRSAASRGRHRHRRRPEPKERERMDTRQYAERYKAAEVTVADPKRLLLLVFEGGTKFLRLTREALAAGDRVGFAENLRRAQAIVAELRGTLDHAAGGTIAADL